MGFSRRPGPTTRVRVQEWRDQQLSAPANDTSAPSDSAQYPSRHEDHITTEEPLEVRIAEHGRDARRLGVTMRTPGHDFELAAGMVFSEGIVSGRNDIASIAYCTDTSLRRDQEFNVVTVQLTGRARAGWREPQMAATSACGVCGSDSIDAVLELADTSITVAQEDRTGGTGAHSAVLLAGLPDLLRSDQRIFDRTGGLHAAGLFDHDGNTVTVREDIGRHNAVDKAVGHCILSATDVRGVLLCTSGRLGFEIVQKAVMAGCSAVVAVGAPSSLAVSLAQRAGITAAGFVRGGRLVVYAGEAADAPEAQASSERVS